MAFKLAAGERDAIDLMEAVGEEGEFDLTAHDSISLVGCPSPRIADLSR